MGIVADVCNGQRVPAETLPAAVEMHVTGSVDDAVKDSFVVNAQDVKGSENSLKVLALHFCAKVHGLQYVFTAVPERGGYVFGVCERAETCRLGIKNRAGFLRGFSY